MDIYFFIFATTAIFADSSIKPIDELIATKTLKCLFNEGRYATYKNDNIIVEKNTGTMEVIFDLINHENNTARFIGNAGATDVFVIANISGINFIEKAPIGNLIITTVFSVSNKKHTFAAVMSRHIGFFNDPIPSQLYGFCKPMD